MIKEDGEGVSGSHINFFPGPMDNKINSGEITQIKQLNNSEREAL